jgi:hypothetical protein
VEQQDGRQRYAQNKLAGVVEIGMNSRIGLHDISF